MKRSLLLLTVLFLASCCGIPQKAVLPLPDPITCPKFIDEELIQVSDETYKKAADLYIACVENDKTLRDIIKSTH
jgi:hypothetical protein